MRNEISDDDCRLWAETLEGRHDVGGEPESEKVLKQFLFEASSPELFEPITSQMLGRWLETLKSG